MSAEGVLMATKSIHCSTTTMREAHVVILGNQLVAGLGSQIAVGQTIIAKDVAVIPKFLDEGGGGAHLRE
jgi:hypothetical protein